MDIEIEWIYRLSVALALGLLVGIERGWQRREDDEGQRVAGLRTFGLVGLLGGLAGTLGQQDAGWVIGLGLLGLGILTAASYVVSSRARSDLGMTTEVAILVTYLLAAMAGLGELAIASSGAVVLVLILTYKNVLHGWLGRIRHPELTAGIKLLLMTVVLLPLLPNEGYGPWQALNPYVIWWMIVLIAAISFVGYFAVRIVGARGGTLFTALFGGLASSTAVTLNFARLARSQPAVAPLLAGGILLACGTMFPRMLLVATLIHAPLLKTLVWPALSMAVVTYGAALWWLRTPGRSIDAEALLPGNPLELRSAFAFGALLALVMLLGAALTEWFGDAGVFALAAASGVADVDAITLSLADMSRAELALRTATLGIVIAAVVNSLVKVGITVVIGGSGPGLRVAAALGSAVALGAGIALFGFVRSA